VAPPGNQAVNGENKHRFIVSEETGLLNLLQHVLLQKISKIWTCATAQRHLSEDRTRTGIERTFGLVKENRYRMEQTNYLIRALTM
jgi:hypothetical protein